jgi:hypothetical protein
MTVTAKNLFEAQYAPASATTVYTAPVSTRTIVDKFTATNTDTVTRTLTVYLVSSGNVAGASYTVLSVKSLATNVTYDAAELQNQILEAGDFISVLADAANKVVVRGSGRELA